MSAADDAIVALRNIGPKSAAWLYDVGIDSVETLRTVGPVVAFLRVRQAGYRPSLNLLWALAAGLVDKDWRKLSAKERDCLADQLKSME